jgi:hypothetical protein
MDMAQWCRDNGIPVVQRTAGVIYSSRCRPRFNFRGSRAMIARGQELVAKGGLTFGGIKLNRKGVMKEVTVIVRECDYFLFRLRYG